MKYSGIVITIVFCAGLTIASSSWFPENDMHAKYSGHDGIADGLYTSYYGNGRKKAEGNFEHNCRTGTWNVWDSTGRLRVSRNYISPYVYINNLKQKNTDTLTMLLSSPGNEMPVNKQGFRDYYDIKEGRIVWSQRFWREMPVVDDSVMLAGMHQIVFNMDVKRYADEVWSKESAFALADTSNYNVIAYHFKEDAIFDLDRLLTEIRPIGVAPFAINKSTGDTTELFWVYFPDCRLLASRILINSETEEVQSLDELIYYNRFAGTIYNVSGIKGRSDKDPISSAEKPYININFFVDMIETEHNLWMMFAPN